MIFISSKVSDGNMSINYGDSQKALANRKKFLKKSGIDPKNVAEVKQVHGNKVILIDKNIDPETEADGLITNKDIYLMMKVADCITIGFFDLKHHAIGLIHVGFRGLENGIIKKAIESMKQNFQTRPKDLKIKISPSIGPCHYRLDLWADAEKQFICCGVLKENINNPKICTYESKKYFSHRRAKDKNLPDYRFATIIGLNNVN